MREAVVLIGMVALLVAGCSGDRTNPTVPDRGDTAPDRIETEMRALLTENEADATDIELAVADLGFAGELAESVWDEYDVYALTIVWGDVYTAAAPSTAMTDWSGTLSVENGEGVVDVRAAIDFERGQDSVVAHNSAHFVQWVSFTNRDVDGLSFLVFLSRTSPTDVEPIVRFATAPFALDLNRGQLADFAEFFRVGEDKAVAVLSRQIWRNTCPGGFMKGEWVVESNMGDTGHFGGVWLDRNGEPVGIMTAQYWVTDEGARLFAGTISGAMLTVVIGEVKGVWAYDDYRMCPLCGQGHGWFRGRFEMNDASQWPVKTGGFGGVFGDYTLAAELRVLPLRGVWRVDCPNTTEVVTPEED